MASYVVTNPASNVAYEITLLHPLAPKGARHLPHWPAFALGRKLTEPRIPGHGAPKVLDPARAAAQAVA